MVSLTQLHKKRKSFTELEARYLIHQLLLGVQSLHDNKTIHRDLKLTNLFLNENMELKIGGFCLATKVKFSEERQMKVCGTPNYMAPEVLNKTGYSYEVDIWAMGCILYTMLVGHPPFETRTMKETCNKIKENDYFIPSRIGPLARALITRMLQSDPSFRPTVDVVLSDEFMTCGDMPSRLPSSCPRSCFTTAPRFGPKWNSHLIAVRRPLVRSAAEHPQVSHGLPELISLNRLDNDSVALYPTAGLPLEKLLAELQQKLSRLSSANLMLEEAEDSTAAPTIWVSKWLHHQSGFGYQLSDDTIGVNFNNQTKLLLLADAKTVQYFDRNGNEVHCKIDAHPPALSKKLKLLEKCRSYMEKNLIKTGGSIAKRDGDRQHLRQWFLTPYAAVMHLSNGTLQINYLKENLKLILCPLVDAVTVIDERGNFRTFRFSLLKENGCHCQLLRGLKNAQEALLLLLESLLQNKE